MQKSKKNRIFGLLAIGSSRTFYGIALHLWVLCLCLQPILSAHAARIEDLCDVRGVRPNQLIGYGLVVGLNRTGDMGRSRFTVQSTAALLRRLGATIDPKAIQTFNAAAVMVTATIPPFSNPGTRLDVQVSSMGNARSLQGGTLLQTPLYGADRKVYAVAQGALVLGGFTARASSGSTVSQNHVTAGRVPNGAIVERDIPMPGLKGKSVVLSLKHPNFITAKRIVEVINKEIGDNTASAVSSGSVKIAMPDPKKAVELIANVQALEVDADMPARVVIDEKTGTVVLGSNVRISEVAIAQGGLAVEIAEQPVVSQPNALSQGGRTAVVPSSKVKAEAGQGTLSRFDTSASLADVVRALNALGAKPRDLIAILQALKTSGALQAELEVQ